jgi:antitoxin component HigA of HigAB toxin-antitoxin module
MSSSDVYERDPHAAPDDAFETGTLEHLVPGNRGRLLDARRTPVIVRRILPETGMFEVEVAAFEDAGACWEIEVERVGSFQFEPGQESADDETVAALDEARRRFDRPLSIPCAETERAETSARIEAARARARELLPGPSPFAALEAFLEERGLATLEEAFAERFVSNASSGELVKGHAIVLAQLGLCPYEGKVVRSPDLFAAEWSEERRADHIVSRLGFVRELHAVDGHDRVTLYRGLASDVPLTAPRTRSFVSATFDQSVAEAHFSGGPSTVAAAIYRQVVPVERIFMTYRETRAMNRQFRESEAVLIGDPGSPLF